MKWVSIIVLFVFTASIYAQSPPDSSRQNCNLFHPTSKTQIRELATDPPDVTESPIS
ncbi:MAG: hypothetical protein Q8891_14660 [Bacteroidota bacterium]|nr:hypothetical protein [Bacteroidota bacterium]